MSEHTTGTMLTAAKDAATNTNDARYWGESYEMQGEFPMEFVLLCSPAVGDEPEAGDTAVVVELDEDAGQYIVRSGTFGTGGDFDVADTVEGTFDSATAAIDAAGDVFCPPETAHIDDETITAAIASKDDPEHPDATTVTEVRNILAALQQSFEEIWDAHMDAIVDNSLELVAEHGDILVFADHSGLHYREEYAHGTADDVIAKLNFDDVAKSVIKHVVHEVAREHCDYDWGLADPVVVRKPADFDAGEELAEAVVNSLISRGLTPREAWAVWGVDIRGNSANSWAARCGYDSHSGISNARRNAHEKLSLPY